MKLTVAEKVAYALVLVGALNWGLIAFFDYNLVTELFGAESGATDVIYALVGLSAVYLIWVWGMSKSRGRK